MVKDIAAADVCPTSSVTVTRATYVPVRAYTLFTVGDVVVSEVPSPNSHTYREMLWPAAAVAAATNVAVWPASGGFGETFRVTVGFATVATATGRAAEALAPAASVTVKVTLNVPADE